MTLIPFLQKKSTACGLDLGSSWLKTVCFCKDKQGVMLERIGRLALPFQSKGDARAMGQAAKRLHTALAIKDKVVTSSLRGHEVIVKHMQLPVVKDMRGAVEREAKEQIPFDLGDLYLDFQIVNSEDKKARKADVMVVATKKKVVADLEQTLQQAGLSLAVVDVDAFALSNCFGFNYPEHTDPAYLLDIGASQSILGVYDQGRPFFFREIGFGGHQITQIISRQLDVSLSEAEALKIKGSEGLQKEKCIELQSIISESCTNWCREIKRVDHFYQTSTNVTSLPSHLYLSGGGSLLPGVSAFLARELKLEVTYLDPWRKANVDSNNFDPLFVKAIGPQFVIASGLALRSCV
jgi:type IV pilus assembly protein PilM